MITSCFFRRVWLLLLMAVMPMAGLFAASESYVQSLTGHLKKGDSLTVIDDKFLNLPLDQWNQLKHLSIDDIITFELRHDTTLSYFTRSFSCTLNVTIKYWTSRDDQAPKEIDTVNLVIKYDTTRGKSYIDVARYQLKNAFKVTVVINSINSPEWKDKLPDCFRLKSQILVERKYPFDPQAKGKLHLGAFQPMDPKNLLASSGPNSPAETPPTDALQPVNGQLPISWNSADFSGAEEYDIEWTYVDMQSARGQAILTTYGGQGPFAIPENVEAQWMWHDATRVTVTSSPYTINLPYQDGYVLVRIRGVGYPTSPTLRVPGSWSYSDDQGNTCVAYLSTAHQSNLNWQYTGSFAEEGKRREVITYFDGSQRDRQNITINNSDLTYKTDGTLSPTAVVQETIYDIMGRPTVSVLPAPTKSALLDYVPSFNLNSSGNPYSYADINPVQATTNCSIAGGPMSTSNGASQYYSPNNSFLDAQNLANFYFNPYIPDAQQYPFSVMQYTPDNTGRVARQGGVGPVLQTGSANDTKYYYGKPTLTELQRMFGQEVGDASHYLKNMVIDANGQAAVTFIDANNKTIATALAGPKPATMDQLPGGDQSTASSTLNDVLIQPTDFTVDAGALNMSATSTFLAEMTGNFQLFYSINPLALTTSYAGGASTLCNNCYYTVDVKVSDPCGVVLSNTQSTPFQVDDFTCYVNPQPITQNVGITVSQLGTYTVTYSLQLSEQVITDQTNYYVKTNTDLKTLQTFFVQELNTLDLSGCYSTCDACQTILKDPSIFQDSVLNLLAEPYFSGVTVNTSNPQDPIMVWIGSAYSALKTKCQALSCSVASPCDQKLTQLEQDVLPGGQYAPYDPTALQNNDATVFLEPATNVMEFYNQDAAISTLTITAADGSSQQVGNLSQADFIRAYLQHPEWASLFVVHHIEYCSYLWCKDASNTTPADNNEVSYTFDANLQQNYQAGSDAVAAGYYNHADPYALLEKDPWFNGGRGGTYYSNMQADLQNLTTALSLAPMDGTVTPATALPVKNINQYIDWLLYCKPTDPNPSAAEMTSSWQSCSPNDNCRSATMEWQLYLQYYMQLKSKYYRIAKLAYFQNGQGPTGNPNCLDCFIGADALSTLGCVPPDDLSNYQVVHINQGGTCGYYIEYKNGTAPFPSSYTITYTLTNFTTSTGTVTCNAGDVQVPIFSQAVSPGEDCAVAGTYQVTGIVCAPTPLATCAASSAASGGNGGTPTCPDASTFQMVDGPTSSPPGYDGTTDELTPVYYVCTTGPVNTPVTVSYNQIIYGKAVGTIDGNCTLSPFSNTIPETATIQPGQDRVYIGQIGVEFVGNGDGTCQGYIGENHYNVTLNTPTISCPAFTCPALSAFSEGATLTRATSFGNGCTALSFQPYVTYSGPALVQQVTVPVQAVNSSTTSGNTTNTTYNYFAVFTPGGATSVNITDGQGNIITYTNDQGCTPTSNTWTFTVGPNAPTCTAVPTGIAPPSSMCTDNTLYQEYAGKTRVFNDYAPVQDYGSCIGSSLSSGAISTSTSTANLLLVAQQNLSNDETNWLSMLTNVRNSVPDFSSITDATLQTLVADLGQISSTYLQIAVQQNTAMNIVSSLPNPLPSGFTAPNGYYSFSAVFNALIPANLVQEGFSADLLGNVYPYNKVPYATDPTVTNLTSDIFSNVSANLTAWQNAWTSAGSKGTFAQYLQQQLDDDQLTADQISDLQARIANGCPNPYLANPTILPAALLVASPGGVANPADPGQVPVSSITCSQLNTLIATFPAAYPLLPVSSTDPTLPASSDPNMIQLFETVFTNYLNHELGYPLSYADYRNFYNGCPTNTAAVLYDEPQTVPVVNNLFSCAAGLLAQTYSRAGQDYTLYINQIRIQFRNNYISKCLSNQASATIQGTQYQYHYTLYYYDQAGNLVKTVPPEGVHLLSDQDLATIQALPAQNPASCQTYPANVVTNTPTILSTLSSELQGGAQSMELWLFNSSGANTRSLRMVTPDGQYMIQAAIANGYVFYEQYSLTPDASGNGIDMTLTNAAVATVPAQEVLQNWSHLVVQSPAGLNGGALTLYLDGNKLTNVPLASAPAYPFGYEIDGQTGGYTLPATDVSQVQQIRIYQAAMQDKDVAADYQNSCMNPASDLTYELWGLFNPQGFCGNNTAASTLVVGPDKGCLTVTSSPPNTYINNYALQDITNTFTIEFWANPQTQDNFYDGELGAQYGGLLVFHPYAIAPFWGGYAETGYAGVGLSVGTNGVTVFEHADQYVSARLIYQGPITGWTHIALEYVNKTPSLYINGVLVATGLTSGKTYVSPSYNWGGGGYGFFTGSLDEGRIWSVARTPAQIAASYNKGLSASDNTGLVGYWPMDGTYGSVIHDESCNGHDDMFYSPEESWTSSGAAPITDNTYVPFANRLIVPNHGIPTYYAYNSLNQAVTQTTPDAGTSNFLYDRVGRLSISQNAEQNQPVVPDSYNVAGRFSYTRYDAMNRVTETGEKVGAATLAETDTRDDATLQSWYNSGSNRQVTVTVYDQAPSWAPQGFTQTNLRKRVAAAALVSTGSDPTQNRQSASYYSYDYDGNVSELMQENAALANDEKQVVTGGTGLKDIQYQYDLISGKVNKVLYQDGKWDQFYYQYIYDADNRLIKAYSSRYNYPELSNWNLEALYRYYLHGPLARMEIGVKGYKQGVQGLDYAYTLQGWLKGVNGQQTSPNGQFKSGMVGDGVSGDVFSGTAADVTGYSLGYFQGDYTSIQPSSAYAFNTSFTPNGDNSGNGTNLYNGNISYSTYAINNLPCGCAWLSGFQGYTYRYDQLNRLTSMNQYLIGEYGPGGTWSTTWTSSFTGNPNTSASNSYGEQITYDGNGNILTDTRKLTTTAKFTDNLTYNYSRDANGQLLSNRLGSISVAPGGYPQDLTDEPAGNYMYDNNGNLIKDQTQHLGLIYWNVYGKMDQVYQGTVAQGGVHGQGPGLIYGYDPGGNRISKTYMPSSDKSGTTTHYVRDMQGNVLAVYQYKTNSSGAVTEGDWLEQHLYGSSRLGMLQPHVSIPVGQPLANDQYNGSMDAAIEMTGNRLYELDNHLGNVMATVTDAVIPVGGSGNRTLAPLAQMATAQDYFPFGMEMPGRTYIAPWAGSLNYRYGYNGKENDNEVEGTGNSIDYGMRVYDPRAGRFLSVDPLEKKFPALTPYQYASNRPVDGLDLDGEEYISHMTQYKYDGSGWDYLKWIPNAAGDVYNTVVDWTWNSGVSTVKNVRAGTYVKNLKAEVSQTASTIKQTAVNSWKYNTQTPILQQLKDAGNTLIDPQTWESGLAMYLGSELLPEFGGGKGNMLKIETQEAPAAGARAAADVSTGTEESVALAEKYAKNRPKFRQGTINKVWEAAKDANGKVYDPNTFEELTWDKFKSRYDQWHMGHKPGFEYRKLIDRLKRGQINKQQFLDEYNNPNNYRPESPAANMSHKFEAK